MRERGGEREGGRERGREGDREGGRKRLYMNACIIHVYM